MSQKKDEFEQISVSDALEQFKVNPKRGLTTEDAAARLLQYGENVLQEKKEYWWKKLLAFFWGPIPWMIEAAALLSAILERWPDFIVIILMLLINAILGFVQEHKAGNAIAALKEQLALHCFALRNGKWQTIEAGKLVPGDIVSVKLGNVIPADVLLIEGEYLSVDQSILTGESLPVTKKVGNVIFSGTIIKMGEMVGVVTKTGDKTFFGKTAMLVGTTQNKSHFEEAFLRMGNILIAATLLICAIILVVSFYRLEIRHITTESIGGIIIFFLVLVVAGIPIASPAVFSVAMAIGAHKLARMKAIVSRLSAIEELASMDILCSDKTGTLTKNKLTVGGIMLFEGKDDNEVLLMAGLASKAESNDAIDEALFHKIRKEELEPFKIEKYTPFDPVRKRAESSVRASDGSMFDVMKGAPQVVLRLCYSDDNLKKQVMEGVEVYAKKGYRTLGVARTDAQKKWQYLGLIALLDPPRADTKQTLEQIQGMGVEIKTVTGDHESIARELSHTLGLGTEIISVDKLYNENLSDVLREELIVKANGFAEVYPEHKFEIVKTLQRKNHIIGMTGDGVNDAPALKQADVGIAVSNATDAARQAADLVLTESGLGVICHAIAESRRTFGRMKSYMLYRMAETFRLLLFLLLAMLVFQEHPLTAIMVILIALLNDIPIMMIAYDHMRVHSHPINWNIKELLTISIGFSVIGVISTFGLFWIGKMYWFAHIADPHQQFSYLQTLAFMGILCGGNLTIYLTRNIGPLWQKPHPEWKFFLSTIVSLAIGTLVSVYGLNSGDFAGLGWKYVGLAWAYILVWFVLTMFVKSLLYQMIGYKESYLERFIHMVDKPLHPE
ncbi:MAG: putative cation-transporting ATPase [Parachlamydiales bacterium]|nr:putative cation-transporting ATPase [Parachlamydiales bacterium]